MGIFLGKAMQEGRNLLEPEAYELLKSYGLPVPPFRLTTSPEEAEMAAREIGYPVVAKVVSKDILHKSDAGGVILNLRNGEEVRSACRQITERAKDLKAEVRGILIAKMSPPGTEVIVGLTQDPQFGPAVMFGLGGIFVEVYQDVAFRLLPITLKDAKAMIREIKGFPILQGVRGRRPADLEALSDLLLKVSRIAEENPEIAEMDLNPVLVYETGLQVVDARVLLHHPAPA